MTATPYLVGVLIPGDGRLHICEAKLEDLSTGDWVLVRGLSGDEPGRVVFPAERVSAVQTVSPPSAVIRRLKPNEIVRVAQHAERARSLTSAASEAIGAILPEAQVVSLRFTLDGHMLLCSCCSRTPSSPESIEEALQRVLNLPVRLEWIAGSPRTFGSLGAFDARLVSGHRPSVRERLGIDSVNTNTRPNGWPRLGVFVTTPVGSGRLLSISVRHNIATVRLTTGGETTVPVEDLIVE